MSCGSRFANMRVCLKMVMNSRYDNHPVKKLKTATTPEILHVSLPIPTPSLSLEVTNILLSLLFMAFPNPTDGQHTYVQTFLFKIPFRDKEYRLKSLHGNDNGVLRSA